MTDVIVTLVVVDVDGWMLFLFFAFTFREHRNIAKQGSTQAWP